MNPPTPVNDRLVRVAAKMWNEAALNVSDAEIERCLGGCVARTKVISWAKSFRNDGLLTVEFIRSL